MTNDKRQCTGCGVDIQTTDKQALGYVPSSALERENIVCQRCFRLTHYNEIQDVPLTDDDFRAILEQVGHEEALIVKIVDIFDFDGSWVPGLQRYAGGNDVLLVGNKADLLPKSVRSRKVIEWMRRSAKDMGLRPIDVMLMSAENNQGVQEVASAIDHYRQGKNVYVVGCTNVGKSTFMNDILKMFSGEDIEKITVSPFPGTTLDTIDVSLEDGKRLIDTPGIVNPSQMAHFVSPKELKTITPKNEIKPRIFQLNAEQTLFFGGLVRFDVNKGERNSYVCYLSNELNIHRTKLNNADRLYENHLGELLSPPGQGSVHDFPELVRHDWTIKEGKTDVVISGLGWVTVNEPGVHISVHVPKGAGVSLRKAII